MVQVSQKTEHLREELETAQKELDPYMTTVNECKQALPLLFYAFQHWSPNTFNTHRMLPYQTVQALNP